MKPGDLVQCINDARCTCCNAKSHLKRGRYYRVQYVDTDGKGIALKGVFPGGKHPFYHAEGFDKVTPATDIFTHGVQEIARKAGVQ